MTKQHIPEQADSGQAMTFRQKLADWISGGEISRARKAEQTAENYNAEWCNHLLKSKNNLQHRLDRIASLETPRCANIGKRMARIARGQE